jgi:hypothetical protein
MSNLRSTIERLSAQFAASVIDALRNVSIEEIYAVTKASNGAARTRTRESGAEGGGRSSRASGRLGRRTQDDIARMVDSIAALLLKNPDGLRAEQIRESLGVEAKELPRPLADGVASGRLTKVGQKRATTYSLGSGEGSSTKRAPRRAARRSKKRG